jgi:hypothetical protein
MIPLRVHNIVDYVAAVVFIAAPYIFGFADIDIARNFFLILGLGLAGYSCLTKYQYSLAKLIPIGPHMFLDVVVGFLCMIGPYVLNYRLAISSGQTAAHYFMGLGIWGLVALTRPDTNILEKSIPDSSVSDREDFRKAA